MTDTISGSFFCPECKGQITWPDDATDETPIVCRACDVTYGTFGELNERFMSEAKGKVDDMIKSALKGFGGNWKLS